MTGVLPCLIPPAKTDLRRAAGPLGDPLLDAYLELDVGEPALRAWGAPSCCARRDCPVSV